jgi:hypothetical protein
VTGLLSQEKRSLEATISALDRNYGRLRTLNSLDQLLANSELKIGDTFQERAVLGPTEKLFQMNFKLDKPIGPGLRIQTELFLPTVGI